MSWYKLCHSIDIFDTYNRLRLKGLYFQTEGSNFEQSRDATCWTSLQPYLWSNSSRFIIGTLFSSIIIKESISSQIQLKPSNLNFQFILLSRSSWRKNHPPVSPRVRLDKLAAVDQTLSTGTLREWVARCLESPFRMNQPRWRHRCWFQPRQLSELLQHNKTLEDNTNRAGGSIARGSIRASHPAAPGSILGVPKNSWRCRVNRQHSEHGKLENFDRPI